jgi:hypothetical protein
VDGRANGIVMVKNRASILICWGGGVYAVYPEEVCS